MATERRIRCRYRILGGHVHCRIFGPGTGRSGDLIFQVEEWDEVRGMHPQWEFIDDNERQPDDVTVGAWG